MTSRILEQDWDDYIWVGERPFPAGSQIHIFCDSTAEYGVLENLQSDWFARRNQDVETSDLQRMHHFKEKQGRKSKFLPTIFLSCALTTSPELRDLIIYYNTFIPPY